MGNTHGHMAPIIGQSRYSLNLGSSSMRVRLTGQDYTGATGQHCREGFYDGFYDGFEVLRPNLLIIYMLQHMIM